MTPKPCPFCGHIGIDVIEGTSFRWCKARCQMCDASSGEVRRVTLGPMSKGERDAQAEQDAIEEWNKRWEAK